MQGEKQNKGGKGGKFKNKQGNRPRFNNQNNNPRGNLFKAKRTFNQISKNRGEEARRGGFKVR